MKELIKKNRVEKDNFFARVYAWARKVPHGKVVTYGQVAALVGQARAARTVGWALHAINDPYSGIPWHRVINARGEISTGAQRSDTLQRRLLEAEGIRFDKTGRVDMTVYQWKPRRRTRR